MSIKITDLDITAINNYKAVSLEHIIRHKYKDGTEYWSANLNAETTNNHKKETVCISPHMYILSHDRYDVDWNGLKLILKAAGYADIKKSDLKCDFYTKRNDCTATYYVLKNDH